MLSSSSALATSPPAVAPARPSRVSWALVAYLVAGVPVLFMGYALNNFGQPILIVYPLWLLFFVTAGLHYKAVFSHRLHVLFYLYFGLLLLATLFAQLIFANVYTQLINILMCFAWFSVFISIYYLVRTRALYDFAQRLLDGVGVAIALSVFLSYLGPQYLGLDFGEVSYTGGLRAFGPFGDQVGFSLGYFALRGLLQRRWWIVLLALIAILMTGTRGALISVSVGGLWLIGQVFRNTARLGQLRGRILFALVLIAVGVFAFFIFTPYGTSPLTRLGDLLWSQDATLQRRVAIEFGWRVFLDYPVLGVGYQGFNRLTDAYAYAERLGLGSDIERGLFTAQNQYLQTAVDAGLPGVLLWIAFLLLLLRELIRNRPSLDTAAQIDLVALAAWLIAMALGNQASVWLLPATITGYLFFLLAGLALALLRLPEPAAASAD